MWIKLYHFLWYRRKLTKNDVQYRLNCFRAKYSKYICFIFSLYHSSVIHNQVGEKVCRWSRTAVFYNNIIWVFATSRAITKADRPLNFAIFHCRMSTNQPAWPVCTTSECWHTRCWHFCSCGSHKTIPSLRELVVTQLWTDRCTVTYLSIGFTQVFIIIARIGCRVKWKL